MISFIHSTSHRKLAIRCFTTDIKNRGNYNQTVFLPYNDTACNFFSEISDDIINTIFELLLFLETNTFGFAYYQNVKASQISTLSFALCCKRFYCLFRTVFSNVRAEVFARNSTDVLPIDPFYGFCFTNQLKKELMSCNHFKMIKHAERAMACHCAKACCRSYQRAFNRDTRRQLQQYSEKHNKLVCVSDNCRLMCVSESGNIAFLYSRERVGREHGERRGRKCVDVIRRVKLQNSDTCLNTNVLEIDSSVMSGPHRMRSSPDGNAVAFIRSFYEIGIAENSSSGFSSVFLWVVNSKCEIEVSNIVPSSIGSKMSAQDVWFRVTNTGTTLLTVAWSTDFMHSSGHQFGTNSSENSHPKYCFSSYVVDFFNKDSNSIKHCETIFNESIMIGTLLTCSTSLDGNIVVTLVKRSDLNGSRKVCEHNLNTSSSHLIRPACIGSPKGAIAAALSPNKDYVVAIVNHQNVLYAKLLFQSNSKNYAIVHTVDVSHLMGVDPETSETDYVAVKYIIDIQFSHCGRFVALVDRHPLFGLSANLHGVVIIDTLTRNANHTKFKLYPLFSTTHQAPRSFHWSSQGIWIMCPGTDSTGSIGAHGGALCMTIKTNDDTLQHKDS
jgi:hypothetical protein